MLSQLQATFSSSRKTHVKMQRPFPENYFLIRKCSSGKPKKRKRNCIPKRLWKNKYEKIYTLYSLLGHLWMKCIFSSKC